MEKENRDKESKPSAFERGVTECAQAVNQGRDDDAERLLVKLFMKAAEEAMADPSPELIWQEMADKCEQIGHWKAAEEARQKVLGLAREHPNPAYPSKFHLDLGSLYEILGRKEEALAEIERALELSRASGIPTLIGMALEAKCNSALGQLDPRGIRASARQALEATPPERIFNLVKTRFLLLEARCAAELGELDAASTRLAAAGELTGGGDQSHLITGYPWYQARAAEISAKIHAARGEFEQAVAAFSEILPSERSSARRHGAEIRPRYRLALALLSFAAYLEKSAKPAEAADARAEASDILSQMKLPPSASTSTFSGLTGPP